MKGIMVNNQNHAKTGHIGFSWTMLFFGVFVPLFRGDFAWFIISLLLSIFTSGFAWLILPFFYNKTYTSNLVRKGYKPVDENFKALLKSKGIYWENTEISAQSNL